MTPDTPATLLPESLQEMAEHIPVEAVIRLVERFGGTLLCIPKRLPGQCELTDAVGLEAAAKLVAVYGGENLDIPRACRMIRAVRNREIVRRRREGAPLKDLARAFAMTMRNITHILRAAGASPPSASTTHPE